MKQQFYEFGALNIITKSKQEVIENIYLQSIIDSYPYIDKSYGLENNIRDRFYNDLKNRNPLTKDLIEREILDITFERWEQVSETEKSRVDLQFFMSQHKFEVECKRLFEQPGMNKPYLDEGLIRFIELKYAEKSRYSGMIGFIVSGDIDKIHSEIYNEAIKFNAKNESIEAKQSKWKNSFISHHKKLDNSEIVVYHLFFQFADKEKIKSV